MNARLQAALIIADVRKGLSLSSLMEPALLSIKDQRDRALVQALVYGACRFYTRLDAALDQLLKKPLRKKDQDIHALLLIGLLQLMEMNIPHHAALAETVNAALTLKKPWAKGFINAVLREYLRKQSDISKCINRKPEAFYAHPLWWIEAIQSAWPHHFEAILSANNEHPPFSLRVNLQRVSRETYLQNLKNIQKEAAIIPETEAGILLTSPMQTTSLPGFSQGHISIQDGAAQLAAPLLSLKKGLRVMDVCAAPGGKLTHILECEPELSALIAVEKNKDRLEKIKENRARLHLPAASLSYVCADAKEVNTWWDGQLVDRILLDAPCSASGVIRRHPDIKLLRAPDDLVHLAQTQYQLLHALWPILKRDGILLYATCSLFPQENTHVIRDFLMNHPDAREEKINAPFGISCEYGVQILPGMQQMDGFYYAKLRKK